MLNNQVLPHTLIVQCKYYTSQACKVVTNIYFTLGNIVFCKIDKMYDLLFLKKLLHFI
jgi:hypothetical protein